VIHGQVPLPVPCSCYSACFHRHGLYLHPPSFRRKRR